MTAVPSVGAVTFSLETPVEVKLRDVWIDLEARADVSPYLSWAWIGAWVAEAGPPDFVLVGRADGEVVCLGLFRRSVQRRHGFVRSRTLCLHETGREDQDIVFIEYNGLLTDRRFGRLEPQAIAFLSANEARLGGFDEIQIGGLAEDGHEALRAAGLRMHVHALKGTAFVDLKAIRDSGGDYLSTVSANTRQQIRRAVRIYEERGPLILQQARNVEEALTFFEEMGALHERSWQGRTGGGAWRYPFLLAFHRRLIEENFATGGIEIARVSCGETPVGYVHCLVRGGWTGSYLSGFAYETDNKVRPGLVSFYLYIESKLKSGGEVFDFLAGDHRYKRSLGRRGANMYWLRVQQPRWPFRLESSLRNVKHRLEALRRKLG